MESWNDVVRSQAKFYNKKYLKKEFKEDKIVWLVTKNICTQHPHKKLEYHYTRLFKVTEQVRKQAYHLQLLDDYKIYLVFNILLLEPYQKRPGEALEHPPLIIFILFYSYSDLAGEPCRTSRYILFFPRKPLKE